MADIENKINNAKSIEELDQVETQINKETNIAKNNDNNDNSKNNQDNSTEKNEENEEEDTHSNNNDGNDNQDKHNEDDITDNNDNNNNGNNKKEKTLISDDVRHKYKIPEKFKYIEDVVEWGKQAEKQKNVIDNQKNKIQNENDNLKAQLEQLKQDVKNIKEKNNELTEDEKQAMNDKFNEQFMTDPIGAIKDIVKEIGRIEPKHEEKKEEQKKAFQQRVQTEWDDITDGMSIEEKSSLAQEYKRITDEHPEIISLYVVRDIYEARKTKKKKILALEQEKKNKQKQAVASVVSTKTTTKDDDIMIEKINNAKSIKELKELEKKF